MIIRMFFLILALFFTATSTLLAEAVPFTNPTTGEEGFFLSRSDMEKATFALLQVPLLEKEITDMLDLRKSDLASYDLLLKAYNSQSLQLDLYKKGFGLTLILAAAGTLGGYLIGVATH